VIQASDGGYALAGYRAPFEGGNADLWLVKTDADGDTSWTLEIGGPEDDMAAVVRQRPDGKYTVAGHTWSYGGEWENGWLLNVSEQGQLEWSRTYGLTLLNEQSEFWDLIALPGNECVISGSNRRSGESTNIWIIKVDVNGAAVWSRTVGGSGYDIGYGIIQTMDGGFALATQFYSSPTTYGLVKVGSCDPPTLSSPIMVIARTNSSIRLNWESVSTATNGCIMLADSYQVYSADSLNGSFHLIATTADTFYVHVGVVNTSAKKYYEIHAVVNPAPSSALAPNLRVVTPSLFNDSRQKRSAAE
jgi:hypothetical protein